MQLVDLPDNTATASVLPASLNPGMTLIDNPSSDLMRFKPIVWVKYFASNNSWWNLSPSVLHVDLSLKLPRANSISVLISETFVDVWYNLQVQTLHQIWEIPRSRACLTERVHGAVEGMQGERRQGRGQGALEMPRLCSLKESMMTETDREGWTDYPKSSHDCESSNLK